MMLRLCLALFALLISSSTGAAHESRPAYLDMRDDERRMR